jgi:hypothetical protein
MVGILACNRAQAPVVGQGDGRFYQLRDAELVPLICPTCQNVFCGTGQGIDAGDTTLLCMGLFSIF